MNLFIAGICGTFMAGIAQIARSAGHHVSGCDNNVYPPMSTLLDNAGIDVLPGYTPDYLGEDLDMVIIGNILSRGNPLVETLLNRRVPYTSGPQWLHDNILSDRKVIAIAGTHGKTTTTSMVAWILSQAGLNPGYLIGGQPGNFKFSAELGTSDWFVIEADEYDSAFFDKRSKFVHYNPTIALLHNLEFDHADIFDDVDQIKKQFHHLVRIVPSSGTVIANMDDKNICEVLDMGSWSKVCGNSLSRKKEQWYAVNVSGDGSQFAVYHKGSKTGTVAWNCMGNHNICNGLAAISVADSVGIPAADACHYLASYIPTARRLQLLFNSGSVILYDDFAHHPTAICATLEAVRSRHVDYKIIAVLEPSSNSMKLGIYGQNLGNSLNGADHVILYLPGTLNWNPADIKTAAELTVCRSRRGTLKMVKMCLGEKSVIICMSNGGFDNIPSMLSKQIQKCNIEPRL